MALKSPIELLKGIKLFILIATFSGILTVFGQRALGQPQPVQLLLENHPTGDTFYWQGSFTELNYKSYFIQSGYFGSRLLETDGTSEGTVVLSASQTHAAITGNVSDIVAFQDKLLVFNINFFVEGDYAVGLEPGFFDPADGSIQLLKDINETNYGSSAALKPKQFGDKLLFLANDGVHGQELWITDGTSDGTILLKDIVDGSDGLTNVEYVEFGEKLLLFINGNQIWETDGASNNTILISDLSSEAGFIAFDDERDLVELDGKLYFLFYSTSNFRYHLWETDGTDEGTLPSISENFNNIRARNIAGELILFGYLNYPEVYKLNTSTNTLELIATVGPLGKAIYRVSRPYSGNVFFNTDGKLWKTDGIDVTLVKEIPGLQNGFNIVDEIDGNLLFFGESTAAGYELWKTDGSDAGTDIVKDIDPSPILSSRQFVGADATHLYFVATDGLHGQELWVSDGTTEGTTMLGDFNERLKDLELGSIAKTDNQFVLLEDNKYQASPNIFRKNGNDRLEPLSNPSGNPTFSHFDHLVTYNNETFTLTSEWNNGSVEFTGLVKIANHEIVLIKEVYSGSNLQVIGDKILFTSDPQGTNSREMWVSDGTTGGTYEVTDIAPGMTDAFDYGEVGGNEGFVALEFDSKIFFAANDQTTGFELWSSDLTPEGAGLVKDINPGSEGSLPRSFNVFASKFIFLAKNSGSKHALWYSDGTPSGTQQLAEFDTDVKLVQYHNIGEVLFIAVTFENNICTLYKTTADLTLLEEVAQSGTYYNNGISPFVGFGNKVLFVSSDGLANYYDIYDAQGDSERIETGYNNLNDSFVIDDLAYLVLGGAYLYRTDGTTGSFDLIYVFPDDERNIAGVSDLIIIGTKLYFNGVKDGTTTPWELPILYASAAIEYAGTTQTTSFEVAFGNESFAMPTEREVVTLNNNGYIPLKFTGSVKFDLAGANPEDFELDLSLISDKINPDDSGEIGITFTPKGIGTRSATLLILTNDEENPLIEIALTGSGTKADPTISFAELPTKSILDEPFDLMVSVDTDQEISFSSSNPEVASTEGKTVTIHKAGTVTVTASVVATELYNAASKQQSLTINGVEQTITFGPLPEKTYGDTPFELTATASSGLDVAFSSSDAAVASVEGVTVTILKAGSATITASQSGNDNYSSAAATQTLTINKAAQTITFAALPANTFGDEPFVLSASSTSGLTVAYASSDATVAKVDGTTVTLLKPGSAAITASQTGNENYLAAASVEQSLVVNKAGQTITFEPLAAKTYGDPAFELSATSSVGLPVTFSSSDPAVVTVEGNSASIVKAGAVTITASQAGNDNYNAASAEHTLTIAKASQNITFDELPTLRSDDDPIELVAEASSGLPVAFQSQDETIATMEGATLTITGSGTTSITATQGGDENYLAAEEVTRSLVVEEVTGLKNGLAGLIKVYPNPTESFISIELPGSITQVSYALTLTTGQKVKEGCLTSQQGKVEIPFDGMWAGTYLLTLTNGELSSTWRIIKN
ncbi:MULTISPECIES: T9SS type A sorting domain-containing protein [unclassified Imperialibacter]|uniref:T9SS type A sorting domain-containing protein n=1 Tax=unclassified Imperialibacter TaxID=2629706 RepID=UPI0019188F6A|nr:MULTISPECIES: T9SS type A sorting domain-containing protein [unclassified Imperialibacter]CAD5270370.1 hypothetical protein IMPERIA89_340405 [Imperialibacter sp. 89]CAD5298169.1 hypothetical protein IMPERIA75_700404 [Imperialibacter sp. 75]